MKERMEKEFNLGLKGMGLKNLGEVNKRFPELSTQCDLSKGFYERLKEYLKEMMKKFHEEIARKMAHKQKSPKLLLSAGSTTTQDSNSQYY